MGKESVMKTFLGTLKDARLFLLYLSTSASSTFDPSLGMIAQYIYQKVNNISSTQISVNKTRYSNPHVIPEEVEWSTRLNKPKCTTGWSGGRMVDKTE